MRPDDTRPRRRAAIGAARRHIAGHLGWLRGYPSGDGLAWIVAPRSGEGARPVIPLDEQLIQRAARAARGIARRFPRALPRIVGDVGGWIASIEVRLDLLRPVVREGAAPPNVRALLAVAAFGQPLTRRLHALADGPHAALAAPLTWIYWDDGEDLDRTLDWLATADDFPVALARTPEDERLRFALACTELGPEAPALHGQLLAWLAVSHPNANRVRRELLALVPLGSAERVRRLRLLLALLPLVPSADGRERLLAATPAVASAFLDLLEALPERAGTDRPRRALVQLGSERLLRHRDARLATALLEASLRLVGGTGTRHPPADATWYGAPFISEMLWIGAEVPGLRALLGEMVTALEVLWERGGASVTTSGLSLLAHLIRNGRSAADAAAFIGAIDDEMPRPWFYPMHVAELLDLTECDVARFVRLVPRIEDWNADDLLVLHRIAIGLDAERRRLALTLIDGPGRADLLRFVRRCGLVGADRYLPVTVPMDDGAAVPPDVVALPAELVGPATRLHALEPTAVGHILGRDFPDRARLEREIAALEGRVAQGPPSLRHRLENLRARRDAPARTPSPRRLERLRARLEHRTGLALLARWTTALQRLMEQESAGLWLEDLPEISLGFARLGPAFRALAARLIEVRAGPPPWDLREDPGNVRLVEGLRNEGLDMAPWIDGVGVERVVAANGAIVYLALEADPLEILQMGHHFQTCLAPEGENFFSCIANAVDINKRVLYGRDAQGRVVGRCLLALTEGGGLLIFSPYAHDPALGFTELVVAFATRLAEQIGVAIVPEGRVTCPVAPAWYDDGPDDLTGSLVFLAEGSAFRAALAEIDPAALVDFVRETVRPDGEVAPALLAICLESLIALPEVVARPALAVPIARSLALERLPPLSRLRLATSLREAGEQALARRVLATFRRRARFSCWELDADVWLAEELVAVGLPHHALDVLRLRHGRNAWRDGSPRAALAVVAALAALHRTNRAAELCRAWLAEHPSLGEDVRAAFRRLLDALEGSGSIPE